MGRQQSLRGGSFLGLGGGAVYYLMPANVHVSLSGALAFAELSNSELKERCRVAGLAFMG